MGGLLALIRPPLQGMQVKTHDSSPPSQGWLQAKLMAPRASARSRSNRQPGLRTVLACVLQTAMLLPVLLVLLAVESLCHTGTVQVVVMELPVVTRRLLKMEVQLEIGLLSKMELQMEMRLLVEMELQVEMALRLKMGQYAEM